MNAENSRRLWLVASFVMSCTPEKNDRQSRPTEEGEGLPSYFDSVEDDVVVGEEREVSIGKTTIKFQKDSAAWDYRVRISRMSNAPELNSQEASVLGDPRSDVIDLELLNPSTGTTIASVDLLLPYEIKQVFSTKESTANIGMMVISDPGTASEQRSLLPSSELSMKRSAGVALAQDSVEITVRIKLKLTNAILWLVSYTEDATSVLQVRAAEELSSVGGTTAKAVTIKTNGALFSNASLSINSGAQATNSQDVVLAMVADGASQMYITESADCVSQGVWETFADSKAWTLSRTNAVARVYVKFRAGDSAESRCVSDGIVHDNLPPSSPTDVWDGVSMQSQHESPIITWTPSVDEGFGIAGYQIAIGSSRGGTDMRAWTDVGNVTSKQLTDLNLTNNTTYYASIRAVDLAGLTSPAAQGDGWTALSGSTLICPNPPAPALPTWIKVPADPSPEVNTDEFCIMKYEARKDGSNRPESRSIGTPWDNIARGLDETTANSAWKACKDLGNRYDLTSNAQWQAIARNIESAQSAPGHYLNWSNNSPAADNIINYGHSWHSPDSLLAASADDDPCFGTDATNCANSGHADFAMKRTHVLSNGEVIWDFSGNAWEWVKDDSSFNYGLNNTAWKNIGSTSGDTCNLPGCSGPQGRPKAAFGPVGTYSGKPSDFLGAFTTGSAGAIIRGGWDLNGVLGIFSVDLRYGANTYIDRWGFRCVYK
jgi:hypothetical protein